MNNIILERVLFLFKLQTQEEQIEANRQLQEGSNKPSQSVQSPQLEAPELERAHT